MLDGLQYIVYGGIVSFFLLIGVLTYNIFKPDKIESSVPIIPEKKLVIIDNKVDTVFIYKK